MSVQNPKYAIPRWSVVGMEGMWSKMFDPPTESPVTPELLAPTNPVPEVMAAAGYQNPPATPHTVQRDLLHGLKMPTWDGKKQLFFMTFADNDNPAAKNGTFPGPTLRIPRGVIFHAETSAKGPPPHTIHWHGIEPTPMNDGVGHCSMELGQYTYQWQPNFIGFYFYHCHRNTMQHFEFGLYGAMLIEPPDAYFATQVLGADVAPIGHCRDGKRRTAANLTDFPQFPGFNGNLLTAPDPWTGDPALTFATDPHAMTVPYDVEALWVLDDRDSVWSDLAPNARQTYPQHGTKPGFNDNFHGHAGGVAQPGDFFAFNDFNADYWFVTGIPVPASKGGTGTIVASAEIPPELNSGVTGTQIPINAQVGQTILVRCLDAAYNSLRITFPVNVVIVAWDGRALGQPPFGFNEAYLVPAGTTIHMSTARRFDALIRVNAPISDFVVAEFINTRSQIPGENEEVLMTCRIPINIGGTPQQAPTFTASGRVVDPLGLPMAGASIAVTPKSQGGSAPVTVTSGADGTFQVPGLINSSYEITPSLAGFSFTPASRIITVNDQNVKAQNFSASVAVGSVTLTAGRISPQPPGLPGGITFSADVQGGSGPFEYQFWLSSGSDKAMVRDFTTNPKWNWDTLVSVAGSFTIEVHVRQVGATLALAEKVASIDFALAGQPPTFTPNSYNIQEALDALRIEVGLKNPTSSELARYDVAPLLNGIAKPDGKIDLADVLEILRMAVGLGPL
ncbi:hypothetical protein GMLC_23950 [Geomonas limicola]|uniref:Plastocyanin-like domain-containing protein n=1 Tax=Geomonas limicola TaxID=2740186 RepID=A0A6V8N8C5_9BACT|nr:carboxypeptidase regulatory-like domain-containing protein [Geomonas limicola]GFO68816.1 hypothetical protein GMLC_23950 [Geomonas limicola]